MVSNIKYGYTLSFNLELPLTSAEKTIRLMSSVYDARFEPITRISPFIPPLQFLKVPIDR